MRSRFSVFISLVLILFYGIACQEDKVLTDNFELGFSTDTVYFDTVLSTLGSVTHFLNVYNNYEQPLELERIFLAGGEESFFRLNLDGVANKEFRNIHIPAKDSLFLFVEVTIDPLDADNPMLIKDSIVFSTVSGEQDVKLLAYGQDVHVFNGEIFKSQTWTGDKPYLIINSAAVDSNELLTIEPGTNIYLTSTSSLLVWGRIEAIGTEEDPIVFTGTRFDGRFEESAGQWRTIFIGEKSTDNLLEHVIIRNATAGIQVGYPDPDNQSSLELRNCMILNSSALGLFAFNSRVDAYNTIFADCGSLAIYIQMGGRYNFYHCVVSNVSAYYPGFYESSYKYRTLPSVFFTNYFDWFDLDEEYRIAEITYPVDVDLNFYNSIIYGTRSSEIYYDTLPLAQLDYRFDHCLVKLHEDSIPAFDTNQFISLIYNEDPKFINDSIALGDYDFHVEESSVAIDAGDPDLIEGIPQLEYDFSGNPRAVDGAPDLGVYESN